ncbi:Acetyltransferase (isoleucine patch superfamily) [Anaerovibrio sp. JC8]|uniref:acyltransferase n=1 Tax=Anaerovibrio sp. JC8 TaxID=1240085 RepID=UPI000A0C17E9|nr:DapH/DapD/GlmU-related protein [Anaerovibrio sp. JC8]ORU01301.1 Acetyltransferase (isoleucine patch superfamily) [Anaerovibrio sp. JC8]
MEEFVVDLRKLKDTDKQRAVTLEQKLFALNHTMPRTDEYMAAIKDIFGEHFGEGSYIVAPLSAVCAENMVIGKNVYINSNLLAMARGGITIEDDVQIAGNVSILSNNHDPYERQVLTCKPVLIKKAAWIGAGATILPGVTVGKHAIVGAGSVVTKDVPDYSLVVGNPAKVVKTLDEDKFEKALDPAVINSYVGSYNFQGGETGYFSMKPYGEGDSLAEIRFLAPEGAEKIECENGEAGWRLADGTELNISKGMFTRRLGDIIEPVIKDPREPGKMIAIAYEVTDGDMTLEAEWSFLDDF